MKILSHKEIAAVSGGDYTVVYVAANINDPNNSAAIASLVAQLMNHQMDPTMFIQAISGAGAQLMEYMHVSGNLPPMPPTAPCLPQPICP